MNSILSKIIIFAAGAGIGSVVTWKLVRDKYERITQEEVRAIRELYAGDNGKTSDKESEDSLEESDEEEKAEYESIIEGANYVPYSKKSLAKEEKEEIEEGEEMIKPYLIDQDEWDESEYETETLYCFADGVITTEMEEVIDDVEDLVGDEAVEWLDESGRDYIYVRNDNNETDYEILRDNRRYSEVE